MATNFETKSAAIPSFDTLVFQNKLDYYNADGSINSATNWPTSQKIGKLQFSNPGDHVAHLFTCVKKMKNPAYYTKYLRIYWTDLHQISQSL